MAGLSFGGRSARALAEIETLFEAATSVRSVEAERIRSIGARHGVDLSRRARGGRRRIYAGYLEHCLEDGELSDDEVRDLDHLRSVLELSEGDVQSAHEETGRVVYGRAISDVLEDLEIDDAERAFLHRLRRSIGLSPAVASDVEGRARWEAHRRALAEACEEDPLFARARPRAGRFSGRSENSLEEAIRSGLESARRAIPALHWFEVERIAGYVGDRGARGWYVTLSAGLDPEDVG